MLHAVITLRLGQHRTTLPRCRLSTTAVVGLSGVDADGFALLSIAVRDRADLLMWALVLSASLAIVAVGRLAHLPVGCTWLHPACAHTRSCTNDGNERSGSCYALRRLRHSPLLDVLVHLLLQREEEVGQVELTHHQLGLVWVGAALSR